MELKTGVHVQAIEIGENRGAFSVVSIKAWDSSVGLWQALFTGKADTEQWEYYTRTRQYNKFAPSICQTTFATSVLRIELDTYAINDFNELDYMKVVGATELKIGVLDAPTQMADVFYIPDPDFNGEDSFTFTACDCAYDSGRRSEIAKVQINVNALNDLPLAHGDSLTLECSPGIADTITLQGSDIDTSNTSSLTYSIGSLPDGATLYDAETGEVIISYPTPLSGTDVQILANYSVHEPPSSFTFGFVTTDERGALSASVALVVVTCRTTRCANGMYFDMNQRACVACPAGTFASDTAVRSSCDDCATGKFAPAEGSMSCGSCANGQVSLKPGSIICIACPAGATCDDTSSLTVNAGMWRGSVDSLDIYASPFGVAASAGGNTSDLCERGYGGVLCALCEPGFTPAGGACNDCVAMDYTMGGVAIVVIIVVVLSYYAISRSDRLTATMESVLFGVELKIYFATCQVLGVYATLLSDVIFPPLKGFLDGLTLVTDISEFLGGFGVSCAHHELQRFKSRLLISTLIPIILGMCIAMVCTARIFLQKHNDRAQLLRTHGAVGLLMLYITLPSVSVVIFKTFSCDGRPNLDLSGASYLVADYSGGALAYDV